LKELVIIGWGAAGFAALIKANQLGFKPTIMGYGPIGGTCVNVGCIPSKRALRIGELNSVASRVLGERTYLDFGEAFEDVKGLVENLRKRKYEDVLASYDAEVIEGKARFVSPGAVKVNGEIIEARKFIIATGSSPKVSEVKGLKEAGFWTHSEALYPDRKVDSLAVIGGRAQALEFAQMYRRLGVDVAVLQRSKVLLPDWEPEVSLLAERMLSDEGVHVFTNVEVREVKRSAGSKVIVTNRGEIEAEEILLATGRKPNVDLNLEAAGVELGPNGGVKVSDDLSTANPNVYAAGDVIGEPMLESLAGYEGSIAAENALTGSRKSTNRKLAPQVIFTQPNIARVGSVEGYEVGSLESRVVWLSELPKASILGDERGLVKMTIERETKRIVSVQMVAENAGDVIAEAALAIKRGLTIDDIIEVVHPFPTVAESLRLAALSFYVDVSRLSCCV